jgi:phosphoribosyl 1,2-cyclic phosphodiesterase
MSLSMCVLASSSAGNSTYVASATTRILIDAGLSTRETGKRLDAIGVSFDDVDAVCVTHEHDDHRKGLPVMHRKQDIALYANQGTVEALSRVEGLQEAPWTVFTTGNSFTIGDLTLSPFSIPHDGYDPVGYVISCGDCRVAVATDMGMPTNVIREHLTGCHGIVMECNYDPELLSNSRRPWSLKQRISGRQGHLSNVQSEELIRDVAGPTLKVVYAAHLSDECNSLQLAGDALRRGLKTSGHDHVDVKMTYREKPSDMTTF